MSGSVVAAKTPRRKKKGCYQILVFFVSRLKKGMNNFFAKSAKIFALPKICVIVMAGTLNFLGFLWLNEGLVFCFVSLAFIVLVNVY